MKAPTSTTQRNESAKIEYVPTSQLQFEYALEKLGRKSARGPVTEEDLRRLRSFIRWAKVTGYFPAGKAVDVSAIVDCASAIVSTISVDADDVVRIAGVLEGFEWVRLNGVEQAAVIWPGAPIRTDKSRELKEQSPNGTVEPVSQTNPSTTEDKLP